MEQQTSYGELTNKYSFLFAQNGLPWGIECDIGWYNIIKGVFGVVSNEYKNTLRSIEYYASQSDKDVDYINTLHQQSLQQQAMLPKFIQIKEKFGTLRMYYDGGDHAARGAVDLAEYMSAITCEQCGNAGTTRTQGWHKTLCDTCEATRYNSNTTNT